jgi:AraC-like DNA-binding protein
MGLEYLLMFSTLLFTGIILVYKQVSLFPLETPSMAENQENKTVSFEPHQKMETSDNNYQVEEIPSFQIDEFQLTKRIFDLFGEEKIYQNHGLNVGEFADRLGVKPRVVTQVLDKLSGTTFKELTNLYRIKYAVAKIEEGYLEKYTLEALGKEAGFNSRITFFNVFKKEMGICPREYWKKCLSMAA